MAFGVVRAFVLGLMERNESPAEPLEAPVGNGEIAAVEPPIARERRRVWGDRRQEPTE
jgi:hypothetical protein